MIPPQVIELSPLLALGGTAGLALLGRTSMSYSTDQSHVMGMAPLFCMNSMLIPLYRKS